MAFKIIGSYDHWKKLWLENIFLLKFEGLMNLYRVSFLSEAFKVLQYIEVLLAHVGYFCNKMMVDEISEQ